MSAHRLNPTVKPAILALAEGSVFHGCALGAEGVRVGEVVFNTSMSGYQEIITDPSYAQQIISFTYPHIGNVGVNLYDREANRVWAAGLIFRELPSMASNWRATQSINEFLKDQNIVGIAQIDTRQLTRLLREKGAQSGCIMSGAIDVDAAIAKAKSAPSLAGCDLAKIVSTKKIMHWNEGSLDFDYGVSQLSPGHADFHVVVYDFGVKQKILRLLTDRGCRLTIVPAQTPVEAVLALNPQGVLLSNGPGDPQACDYAITAIKKLLAKKMPLFGICLGFQLLALACGAGSKKMKFGHHGANHPVQDLRSKSVFITSQNHGFVIADTGLPDSLQVTHRSLFDKSIQGIAHVDKPAFGFQGHPEASPGPHEIDILFDEFIDLMANNHIVKEREAHA